VESKIPRHVVITAAGRGSRMKSVNSDLPKELLPISDKPAIQYAIDEAVAANMNEIIVVLSGDKRILQRYFEDDEFRKFLFPSTAFEINQQITKCNISFAYQDKPNGEMDAISCAAMYVRDNPFAIIYPDNINYPFCSALSGLRSAFMQTQIDTIGLSEVNQSNAATTGNKGRIEYEEMEASLYRITKFYPKTHGHFQLGPMKSTLRTCGMMISNPHLFEYIEKFRDDMKGKEYIDFDVRQKMLDITSFIGYRLPGVLFDVGNPQGYFNCNEYLLSVKQ
jgi:UTP--glucose-1-phosphate uridylyltransferase